VGGACATNADLWRLQSEQASEKPVAACAERKPDPRSVRCIRAGTDGSFGSLVFGELGGARLVLDPERALTNGDWRARRCAATRQQEAKIPSGFRR